MSATVPDTSFDKVKEFFHRNVVQRATKPIKNGFEIALFIDRNGPITLTKENEQTTVKDHKPESPDMTFWATSKGIEALLACPSEDIGEVGIEIMKLMANHDPALHLKAKVHVGAFTLLRHGYMSVLPLGGGTVMKFFASKGLTSISKIKDAITSLKG